MLGVSCSILFSYLTSSDRGFRTYGYLFPPLAHYKIIFVGNVAVPPPHLAATLRRLSAVVITMSEDPGLQPMVAGLVTLCSTELQKTDGGPHHLGGMVDVLHALVSNRFVQLEPYLSRVLPILMSVVLGRLTRGVGARGGGGGGDGGGEADGTKKRNGITEGVTHGGGGALFDGEDDEEDEEEEEDDEMDADMMEVEPEEGDVVTRTKVCPGRRRQRRRRETYQDIPPFVHDWDVRDRAAQALAMISEQYMDAPYDVRGRVLNFALRLVRRERKEREREREREKKKREREMIFLLLFTLFIY